MPRIEHPTHPVPVVVNPGSGPSDGTADELAALAVALDIEERPGDQLASAVRRYADAGAPIVGVAGGDGSIRSAAQELVGTTTALLAVPGGTHNHFANLVGLHDIATVGEALTNGDIVAIDVGRANDYVFVNNVSIGWYAALVADRDELTERWGRRLARVMSILRHAPQQHRFTVTIEGQTHHAWMVFVGNGEHGLGPLSLTERELPRQGRLDVRVLRGDGRLARARVVLALLTGRIQRSDLLVRHLTDEVRMQLRRPGQFAVDGEVVDTGTSITVRIEPGAVRVLMAASAADTAESGAAEG